MAGMKKSFISAFILVLFVESVAGQISENYFVRRASFSSTKFDEFSPVYYKGGLVFCSNRNSGLFNGFTTSQNKAFFKIYQVDTAGNVQWQDTRLLRGAVSTNVNNGPATFNRKGDTIYFSRNLVVEGSFKDITGPDNKLGLFYAVLRDDEWTDVTELRFNDNSWNVTTPFISPDGKRLYFASDKPEGLGGSDIYYSQWKDGYWNNPVNLGRPVNTGGNEAYPFINEAGELFFSSDSIPGKGGKDIFFTRFADTAWIKPIGLAAPINSADDDFGFVTDNIMSRGYFSSNRATTIDIFSFRTINPQFLYCREQTDNSYCFTLPDDATIDIDPLSLQFRWDFGDGQKFSGYVVEHCFPGSGKYSIRQDIIDRKTGKVVFNKARFELELTESKMPRIAADDIVLAGKPVSLDAGTGIEGYKSVAYYWDFGTGTTEKGASVVHTFKEKGEYEVKLLVNMREGSSGKTRQECVSRIITVKATAAEKVKVTDKPKYRSGLQDIENEENVSLRKLYSAREELAEGAIFVVQVLSSEKKLDVDNNLFNNVPEQYMIRRKFIPGENRYSYFIAGEMNLMAAYPAYQEAAASGMKEAIIRTYIPTDTGEVELWNFKRTYGITSDLYFVNNGFSISQNGIPILDRLALLLRRNPSLRILVEAHTDNAGSITSSLKLSASQAQSIVDYLVSKGIEKSRLSAAGLGGSRPVAPEYPESERMRNRRVDFISLSD